MEIKRYARRSNRGSRTLLKDSDKKKAEQVWDARKGEWRWGERKVSGAGVKGKLSGAGVSWMRGQRKEVATYYHSQYRT